MDLGVKRLHPPVHHLGKAGQIGDVAHLEPGLAQRLGGAAGRDQFDAVPGQRLPELDQPGLVRHGQQSAGDLHVRHARSSRSPVQDARLSSQEMVMPSAGVSPVTTSCSVACGRASPSIHRLSSTASGRRGSGTARPRRRAAAAARPARRRWWSPRPRARGGSAPRTAPARLRRLRPAAISRSSPASSRPSLDRLSRRSWIRP